jgi:signal transduction histidine kinase
VPDAGASMTELTTIDPVLDDAPCGFVSFTDDGTVQMANRTLATMLGVTAGALVGRHVESMLTVGSRIFYQTHLFPLLRLHGRADEIFLLLRAANGDEIAALANAVRRQRDGVWVSECVLLRLVERRKFEDALLAAKNSAETARVEMERQRQIADEANQAKSAFLATMSHELRTPLNAIGGYVQLLEMGIHGPVTTAQADALSRVTQSQRHLLRLINEILNLARIESGRVEYVMRDVPLADVAESVSPMIEPQLAARQLHFTTEIAANVVAHADREKLEQILLNLLSNAMKFTPPGGSVVLAARTVPGNTECVELSVSDTGSGIPPDRLQQIFEPFVQVDVSLANRKAGTGLGLTISRDLARGMGGDLTATSTVVEGSVFTLTLHSAGGR